MRKTVTDYYLNLGTSFVVSATGSRYDCLQPQTRSGTERIDGDVRTARSKHLVRIRCALPEALAIGVRRHLPSNRQFAAASKRLARSDSQGTATFSALFHRRATIRHSRSREDQAVVTWIGLATSGSKALLMVERSRTETRQSGTCSSRQQVRISGDNMQKQSAGGAI